MPVLNLHHPEVDLQGHVATLKATLEDSGTRHQIWYSTSAEYAPYFCHERSDAFAIPLLLHSMRRNVGLKMEAPVSERLYYTWTNYVARTLVHIFPDWHDIPVDCPVSSVPVDNAGGVGTGLSCGIDSFSTVADHLSSRQPKNYRLTHCTFFNVGNHDPLSGGREKAQRLFRQRAAQAQSCADEMGLPLVVVDSNIDEFVDRPFAALHTFRNVSGVLALQRLFRAYYYASGHSAYDFRFSPQDSGDYDIFSLPMLSTESLQFFPAGTLHTRVEKTGNVGEFPPSYKHLNVCLFERHNCSRCEKCLRTMLTLDVLGKLHLYAGVFDLNVYEQNKAWYIGYVLAHRHSNSHYREIWDAITERGFSAAGAGVRHSLAWQRRRVVSFLKRHTGSQLPRF